MGLYDDILKSVEDEINKCNNVLKGSKYYKVANEVCEKYGYKLKKCKDTELVIEDEEHTTLFDFTKFLERTDLIDFTGENTESKYSLDEIMGFYDDVPIPLKDSTNCIYFDNVVFDQKKYDEGDMEQFHIKWSSKDVTCTKIYDSDYKMQNVIKITPMVFRDDMGDWWNFERCFTHEMVHCLDMPKWTDEQLKLVHKGETRVSTHQKMTDDEYHEYYELRMEHGYNYSEYDSEFEKLVEKDKEYQKQNGYSTELVSYYAEDSYNSPFNTPINSKSRLAEHFAEMGSIVSFKNQKDKTNAKTCMSDGTILTYEDIKERYPNSFKYIEDIMYNNK